MRDVNPVYEGVINGVRCFRPSATVPGPRPPLKCGGHHSNGRLCSTEWWEEHEKRIAVETAAAEAELARLGGSW